MKDCGIYQWRNVANGKLYIGSSENCTRRLSEHRSRLRRGAHINAKLQASWLKHGESAFVFEMIFSVFNRDDLESVEQLFLDDLRTVDNGYNLAPTAGNTAGWKASDETRKRMSDAAKKRDNSVQILAMAASNKGKKRPEHVVQALLKSRIGAVANQETRLKMSESAKARGDNMPAEARAKLNAFHKAKAKFTPEQAAEMSSMREAGKTLKEIGAIFGISAQSSVHLNIKRWRREQGKV